MKQKCGKEFKLDNQNVFLWSVTVHYLCSVRTVVAIVIPGMPGSVCTCSMFLVVFCSVG